MEIDLVMKISLLAIFWPFADHLWPFFSWRRGEQFSALVGQASFSSIEPLLLVIAFEYTLYDENWPNYENSEFWTYLSWRKAEHFTALVGQASFWSNELKLVGIGFKITMYDEKWLSYEKSQFWPYFSNFFELLWQFFSWRNGEQFAALVGQALFCSTAPE